MVVIVWCKTKRKKSTALGLHYMKLNHYSVFNFQTVITIFADFSIFTMMTNLFKRVCGVFRLFVLFEGSKTGTVLLQMCVFMTNMGLIITVKQQQRNILFWWPCIFGLAKSSNISFAGLVILKLQSLSKEMCLWKLRNLSMHSNGFTPRCWRQQE